MNKPKVGPRQGFSSLTGARITVLGYGDVARTHACGLRHAGNEVSIGLRLGGMSWIRAREDAFDAGPPSVVIDGADVVVVLVPDDEQPSVYFHAIEPQVPPRSLLVFGRALALETGVVEVRDRDVVLVTGEVEGGRGSCRIAVHHDASGRALERATSYARAAFGEHAAATTTTVSAEATSEIAALAARAGGVPALLEQIAQSASRVRESHAPEEAKVAFYEGMHELVERYARGLMRKAERGSGTSLTWKGPRGGVA